MDFRLQSLDSNPLFLYLHSKSKPDMFLSVSLLRSSFILVHFLVRLFLFLSFTFLETLDPSSKNESCKIMSRIHDTDSRQSSMVHFRLSRTQGDIPHATPLRTRFVLNYHFFEFVFSSHPVICLQFEQHLHREHHSHHHNHNTCS